MGKAEQTGGIGRNPAIDKLNKVEYENARWGHEELIKKLVFEKKDTFSDMDAIKDITEKYHISFNLEGKSSE